jgi:hypothetical protein
VKPGGIVVFHEFDCPGLRASYPACPLFDQVNMLVDAVFRRGGASAFGRRLGKTLLDAGLPSQLWRQKYRRWITRFLRLRLDCRTADQRRSAT